MSPFSGPVLLAAALLSSPAWWPAFVEGDGMVSLSVALIRFLVSVLLVWAAINALLTLVGPPPPVRALQEGEKASDVNPDGEAQR